MPVIDAETKNERLLQVQIFARSATRGIPNSWKLPKLLNVSERTARRYIIAII